MRQRRGFRCTAIVTDGRVELDLTFFSRHKYDFGLRPGIWGVFAGTVTRYGTRRQLTHPEMELLDVTVQAQILDLIGEQRRDRNMSVILVTHDLGVVAGHTDEIAVMYGGKLVEKAPTRVLFANMKMPYTEALLNSIPKIEDPSHTRLHVIPGRPPDLVNPPKGCRFAPRCSFTQDRCREEEPPLMNAEHPEHVYACWYPVGSPVHRERSAQLQAEKVGAV